MRDGLYHKKDDLGNVPFLPWTYSLKATMEKTKIDFESTIDYDFILSPVGDEGGFGYLSPSNWIALNKNSTQKAWALEFLNYLFSESGNRLYADNAHIVPNSVNAPDFIKNTFHIPASRISDVGQASFDYSSYSIIKTALVNISKSNREKNDYMIKNRRRNLDRLSLRLFLESAQKRLCHAEGANSDEKIKVLALPPPLASSCGNLLFIVGIVVSTRFLHLGLSQKIKNQNLEDIGNITLSSATISQDFFFSEKARLDDAGTYIQEPSDGFAIRLSSYLALDQ
jgi:hypothetical protein